MSARPATTNAVPAWQHADVVQSVAAALMLREARRESFRGVRHLSRVCRRFARVLRDPVFTAAVFVPWLAPYRALQRVERQEAHAILQAVDTHPGHVMLTLTAFTALIDPWRNKHERYADDLLVRVAAGAMATHADSPCVQSMACLVLARHCRGTPSRFARVAASGALALAVEAEHRHCADDASIWSGFQLLLKAVQFDADAQAHVLAARAGRAPPAYAGYHRSH